VNFTAALVPISLLSDVLGRALRKESLTAAGWWTLLFAACITPFTGLAGLMWKRSVGDMVPPELLRTHQWLGIALAVALIALAIWRGRIHARKVAPSIVYLIVAAVVVVAVIYQGSLGGQMAFGS
jgi:uncharacterized membrane protein